MAIPFPPKASGGLLSEKGDDSVVEVRHDVTLHPETVQKAEILVKERRKSRRKPKKSEPEVKRRYTKKPKTVHPQVWKKALELSGNQPKRIIVQSDTEVLVVNRE